MLLMLLGAVALVVAVAFAFAFAVAVVATDIYIYIEYLIVFQNNIHILLIINAVIACWQDIAVGIQKQC